MSVKIKDLKQNEVRKVISVMFDDNRVEQVTIYNPTGEKRKEILEMMNDYSNKEHSESLSEELTKNILKELTDLKIYKKDNIEEIINNPRGELLMVLKEVNEIKTELEYEFWTYKLMEINQATINLLSVQAMEKSRRLFELSEELEISTDNLTDLEDSLEEELSTLGGKSEDVKEV